MNVECIRDVDEPFIKQAALAAFHLDKHVPGYAGDQGDLLLCEPSVETQRTDAGSDGRPGRLPSHSTLGVVVAAACRHAVQSDDGKAESLYN
ncbi:hypothetical protein BOO86_21505 [Mycobacterium sp. CBMA 234]|nr:hypothetical protein [Mycolicibacterium sp. CBMA 234]